jgi:hypothetical protein
VTNYARILVTLETDPTRYHGEGARTPALPGRAACEQVLAHLVTDLERIFPDIRDFSIALGGSLYDQTQILRPRFPVFTALERALESPGATATLAVPVAASGDAVGAEPPDPGIQPGLLQNLPLVVAGHGEKLDVLAEAMEHRFLEQGQLSAHSAKALEAHFGVAVQHARFMTLTDLQALLKLQLEHFGFSGLWTLLDAVLENMTTPMAVTGRGGQRFEYHDGKVTGQFESFDFWARHGGGKALASGDDMTAGYTDWTREYRQFITTLQAHAVPLTQQPASPECCRVEGDYLVEESIHDDPGPAWAEVTEHGSDDLGVIAVSVLDAGRQQNFYPLTPSGLNTIHRTIREHGLGPAGFAFPGRIVHDPNTRRLRPDRQG